MSENVNVTSVTSYQSELSLASEMQALSERFAARGVVKSVLNGAGEQIQREEETRAMAPDAYRLSTLSDATIQACYRGGKETMTSNDLLRYFSETHEKRIERTSFSEDTGMDLCPVEEKGEVALVKADKPNPVTCVKDRVRSLPATVKKQLTVAAPTWFDAGKPDTSNDRKTFPLSALAAMVAVAVSLMLIVASSVLVTRAENNISSLKLRLSQASAEVSELKSDLDVKHDLLEIRRIATEEYGMVSEEFVKMNYLILSSEESVEVYEEDREESVGLAALLSAIGIK